ncbi:MAG TPA: CBASS cGAMP-activated phospholipase [Candidatus Kapabacteria bacterium]|nr:CBASS cGAMP-activated phospholipase [Candidatus Kapabacteria bacterium]
MGKTFKILSIDGGGIKGLYSARILQEFEEISGLKVKDCFNMICGTSTGGIIALALSIGKSASEIVNFYKKYGEIIFPCKNKLSYFLSFFFKQLLIGGKYNDKGLYLALNDVFGSYRIQDSETFLCIPSYNLNLGRPRVFKKDHHNLNLDNNYSMVNVALATSAAPTYFPIADFDNQYFVDGGVWANNPALCGYIEAKKYFLNDEDGFDKIELLSVSSITTKSGWERSKIRHRSILFWSNKLFELPMNSQSHFTDYFLQNLGDKQMQYKRLPSFENLSCKQEQQIKLDFAPLNSLQLIETLGKDVGSRFSKNKEFLKFFKHKEN